MQQARRQARQRWRRRPAAGGSGGGGASGASGPDPPEHGVPEHEQRQPAEANREGAALATEFAALVNELGGPPPLLRTRRPTHLMQPLACIEAQMEALQVRRRALAKSCALACIPSGC